MKQVFKCDYCTTILPEDECKEHEKVCSYNPKNRSCYSCKNARLHNERLEYCKIKEKLRVGCIQNQNSNCKYGIVPKMNCEQWDG